MSVVDVYVQRRSWSSDEKRAILSEAFGVGANLAFTARRHGLQPQQLYRWRDRLGLDASKPLGEFIPVHINADDGADRADDKNVLCAGVSSKAATYISFKSVLIQLPGDVDAAYLARVAAILARSQ